MADTHDEWVDWAKRLRAEIKKKESTLGKAAAKMDLAESTLRSWTNGTREVNLSDFFILCKRVDVDPSIVLFGRPTITEAQHKALHALTESFTPATTPTRKPVTPKPRRLKTP